MLQDLLIPFITIAIAELGDKTQLAVLSLASKTKEHLKLLAGIMLAFAIADGFAVLLGEFVTTIIPIEHVKMGAAVIFIMFGVIILINFQRKEERLTMKKPFFSGFSLILISEMGDKTQIASGLFATTHNHVLVFIGVMAALAVLSLMAIYLGKFIAKKIDKEKISIIAGILFIVVGILSFF